MVFFNHTKYNMTETSLNTLTSSSMTDNIKEKPTDNNGTDNIDTSKSTIENSCDDLPNKDIQYKENILTKDKDTQVENMTQNKSLITTAQGNLNLVRTKPQECDSNTVPPRIDDPQGTMRKHMRIVRIIFLFLVLCALGGVVMLIYRYLGDSLL